MADTGLPSSQVALVKTQFGGTVSATEYVPAVRAPELFDWPSESEKSGPQLGSNVKLCGSPAGAVCFSTMIVPTCCVLTKVQATVARIEVDGGWLAAVVARRARELPALGNIDLLDEVRPRLEQTSVVRLPVGQLERGDAVALEFQDSRIAVRIGLLLDDDVALLPVHERAGDGLARLNVDLVDGTAVIAGRIDKRPAFGLCSETEYVPGSRSPDSFDCPSESKNGSL